MNRGPGGFTKVSDIDLRAFFKLAAEGGENFLGFLKDFQGNFDDFELIITCPPLFKLKNNKGGQVIRNTTDRRRSPRTATPQ